MRLGDLSESKVQTDLVEYGANVSLPLYDTTYDLVAEIDGNFYRVQVKRASSRSDRNGDVVQAQLKRSGRDYDNNSDRRKYDEDDFDILAVWCSNWDRVAYTEWRESKWSYTLRRTMDGVDPQQQHMVNLLEEETLDSAIESFK